MTGACSPARVVRLSPLTSLGFLLMLQEKRESQLPVTRFLANQHIWDEKCSFKVHLPLVFTQEHLYLA